METPQNSKIMTDASPTVMMLQWKAKMKERRKMKVQTASTVRGFNINRKYKTIKTKMTTMMGFQCLGDQRLSPE